VIIASSSSGLTMSEIQSDCRVHPERCVIGHPFNPPHLIPLVEIVGGAKTSEATIERAAEFYTSIGQADGARQQGSAGHVANRLQAALAREVYYLVAEGVVSAADVDTALSWGPGLRWGIMGNMMLNHLGGGPGGIEHFFQQFTGPMTAWWKTLGLAGADAGSAKEAHRQRPCRGRLALDAELEAERDEVLLGLIELRLSAYELAETTDDENERARQMTFVLVGAGPTGVELAASMAQLATVTLRGQFRRIDPAKSSIILIEGGKRILPTFAESLAKKAARRLEKLGVKIMTGVKVEKVDENGVVADGKRIPSATVLWTAGVAPSPCEAAWCQDGSGGQGVGWPVHECSRMSPACSSSAMRHRSCAMGRPVPGVAQAAIQQGRYVGRLIARQLKGREPKASIPILRQGQHGGRRQEFRHPGERAPSHERVSHLARLGLPASHVASAAAEPVAGANPVALVLFHRAAQLAIDPGTTKGRNQ
jgi:hypothetical protein